MITVYETRSILSIVLLWSRRLQQKNRGVCDNNDKWDTTVYM